jgi:hypothetical protein
VRIKGRFAEKAELPCTVPPALAVSCPDVDFSSTCLARACGLECGDASVGFIWARGYDNALAGVARHEGFAASLGGKTAPVTKEAVAAKLATFSDEELAALGLSRKKGKK